MSNPTSVIDLSDDLATFLARTNQFGESNQTLIQQKFNKRPADVAAGSPGFPSTESNGRTVAQWFNMVDDFLIAYFTENRGAPRYYHPFMFRTNSIDGPPLLPFALSWRIDDLAVLGPPSNGESIWVAPRDGTLTKLSVSAPVAIAGGMTFRLNVYSSPLPPTGGAATATFSETTAALSADVPVELPFSTAPAVFTKGQGIELEITAGPPAATGVYRIAAEFEMDATS